MYELNGLTASYLHNLCRGCLKVGEDVRPMSAVEINSYQNCLNKYTSDVTNMSACNLCGHLMRKLHKFMEQCHKAVDVINGFTGEEINCDYYITSIKPLYDLKRSDINIVEVSNENGNYNNFPNNIFDHDIYVDEEDIPLLMLKTEEETVDAKVIRKRKKKNWKKTNRNEEAKDTNRTTMKRESVLEEMECKEELQLSNCDNDLRNSRVVKEEFKLESELEEGKRGRKKKLREGFTSRMVQETDEYMVIKLNKEQVLKEMDEKSKSDEYLRSLYKCEKCVKGFNFEDVLSTHMEKHVTKKGWLQCDICYQYCPSVVSMRGHMKSHTTRYRCKVCGCVRLSRQVLLEHHARHTSGASQYACQHCEFHTSKRTSMQRHVRSRHNQTAKHPCHQCGRTLNTLEALRVHATRHDKSKRVKCDKCDRWFVYPSLLQQHQMAVHVRGDYYCVECDVRFKSRENLSLHFKRNKRHRDISTFKYECDHCRKRFMFLSALSSHLSSAHGPPRHPHKARAHNHTTNLDCENCHNTFTCHALGWRGARLHNHTTNLDCEDCHNTFTRKSVLRAHLRTHSCERATLTAHDGGEQRTKEDSDISVMTNQVPLTHLIPES